MSERDQGYRQGIKDAEKVCEMMAISWAEKAQDMTSERRRVADLIVQTLRLAGSSIQRLEPGIISSVE